MKSIQTLIKMFGGLDKLRLGCLGDYTGPDGNSYIRIENPGYMRLVIEWISPSEKQGFESISVAHYYIQEGDAMRDPEITFDSDGLHFNPLTFQQDNLGIFHETNTARTLRDCHSFCRLWDSNLQAQGFIAAYQRQIDAHQASLKPTASHSFPPPLSPNGEKPSTTPPWWKQYRAQVL